MPTEAWQARVGVGVVKSIGEDRNPLTMRVAPRGKVLETNAGVDRKPLVYPPVVLYIAVDVEEVEVWRGLNVGLRVAEDVAFQEVRQVVAAAATADRAR
jgi:hypothetical protein